MNGIDRDTEAYVNTLSNEECLTLWTTGSLWDAQSNPLAQALARRALADPPLREAFLNATPESPVRSASLLNFIFSFRGK